MTEADVGVRIVPGPGDALLIVDVQNDFLPKGRLPAPGIDAVMRTLNQYLALFAVHGLPVFATRKWHPVDHCMFAAQGGPWPPHCIQATPGAALAGELRLPEGTRVVAHGSDPAREALSAFTGTRLEALLKGLGVRRLFTGGVLADYGVRATVTDALALGLQVVVLEDAICPRGATPAAGPAAITAMRGLGATSIRLEQLDGDAG